MVPTGRDLLQTIDGGEVDYDYLIPYHGWLMATAFCAVFPLGILMPMLFKRTKAWSYLVWVHAAIQVLGALFISAGIGLGAKLSLEGGNQKSIHRAIGISVVAFAWAQVVAGLTTKFVLKGRAKGLYNVSHWWVGGIILAVGIGNTYYGMTISLPATRYFVAFSVVLGGAALIGMFGQILVSAAMPYDRTGQPASKGNPAAHYSQVHHNQANNGVA